MVLDGGKDDKKISAEGLDTLNSILESIKVVSIDSETHSQIEFDDSSVKTDRVTSFFAKLQDILAQKLPNSVIPLHTNEYAKRGEPRQYWIDNSNQDIFGTYFEYKSKERPPRVLISFGALRHGKTQKDSTPVIEKHRGKYNYWYEGKEFYLYFELPMTKDDFLDDQKLSEIADEAVRLYAKINEIQKTLE